MTRLATSLAILACAVSVAYAQSDSDTSLIPKGIRLIATPDDNAIILVSDPTNGTGKGLEWLGIGGAIACDADNSIIVWSRGYAPPAPPAAVMGPVAPAPVPPANNQYLLWPEGIENAVPFDLDSSIILGSIDEVRAKVAGAATPPPDNSPTPARAEPPRGGPQE